MLFTKAALCLSSLVLLASAQEFDDASLKGLTPLFSRTPTTTSSRLLMSRDLHKRCTGSCEDCFGDGYTLCPDSSIYCYLPGDDYYGIDSCTSSGSGSGTATASSSASTSTSTSGTDDICYETSATCASCFGPTYIDCPDGYHCYDPNDPLYDTCPDDDSSSGSSGSGGSSNSSDTTCEDVYGSGSVPCGDDSCYNPDDGDVCCTDGYHCEGGYTCSTIVGKCCAPGSTLSSCSGSSGGLSTTKSGSTFATSTSGLTFSSATSTNTASGGSSTGISQISDNANAGCAVAIQKGLMIAAGVGALIL